MRYPLRLATGLSAILVLAAGAALGLGTQTPAFDLVIRNGRVVDGTGSPWFRADVGIRGDAIVAVASALEPGSARLIDASGQVVAPGFIDIHTHARRGIFDVPTADNYVRQGVTTVMEGQDGSSAVPLAPFLAKLAATRTTVNVGTFIGQGSVRSEVVGQADRAATADEIARMETLVAQGMEDGAFGLSTGLFYVPGTFTPTSEVVALARVAGRAGGIHISHQRDEAGQVRQSVEETIAIGEGGGLPTQITHHKAIGAANWGASTDTLRLVDEARARGVDVTMDVYPYTASSTSINAALLPAWAQEGGARETRTRLKDPAQRKRIRAETAHLIRNERGGGDPANVQIASCAWNPDLAGRTLADIARQRGLEPTVDNAAETTLWIVEQGGCQGIFHAMHDDDLDRIITHPASMIASDGEVPIFGRASPHPRSYGTFARTLAVYVRERKLLTLEDAVRRMSSFPATRLRLTDRGVIRPGMKADLTVFDPAAVRDLATYDRPHQYAEGFEWVIVNGEVIVDNGEVTGARPGRVLYGPGSRPRAVSKP